MSIAAIIDRLETIEDIAVVETPWRNNPLQRDRYPVATVYPSMETEAGDGQSFMTGQQIEREYLIVLTVNSHTSLDTVRDAIVSSLSGYKLPGTATPLRYLGGRVIQLDGAPHQWSLRFSTLVCYG